MWYGSSEVVSQGLEDGHVGVDKCRMNLSKLGYLKDPGSLLGYTESINNLPSVACLG